MAGIISKDSNTLDKHTEKHQYHFIVKVKNAHNSK